MKFTLGSIAHISSLLTILGFFFTLKIQDNENLKIGILIVIAIIFIIGLLWDIIEVKKYRKKMAYAEAIPKISAAISQFINDYRHKQFLGALQTLQDSISKIFSELKGVDCYLTVKLFSEEIRDGKKFKTIKTQRSEVKNGERADREKYRNLYVDIFDFIEANTDLTTIYENVTKKPGKQVYFFSKDLSRLNQNDYKNSVLEFSSYYENLDRCKNNLVKWFRKIYSWPLPYKSTIVVPIARMASVESRQLVGTLCLDSVKKNTFNEKIDLSLIQSISETIFLYLIYERDNISEKKVK